MPKLDHLLAKPSSTATFYWQSYKAGELTMTFGGQRNGIPSQ